MKDPDKIKRINLNVPLYLLKEIDELAKKSNETRTDIIVEGTENLVEERKRKEKLNEFLNKRKKGAPQIFTKEVYELGTNEWVRRLREEWDIREKNMKKDKK